MGLILLENVPKKVLDYGIAADDIVKHKMPLSKLCGKKLRVNDNAEVAQRLAGRIGGMQFVAVCNCQVAPVDYGRTAVMADVDCPLFQIPELEMLMPMVREQKCFRCHAFLFGYAQLDRKFIVIHDDFFIKVDILHIRLSKLHKFMLILRNFLREPDSVFRYNGVMVLYKISGSLSIFFYSES